MSTIADRKTVKMLGDFVRAQLIESINCASTECECGGDFSDESKSRFIDGWVRRYRKGLREGGAAGLAYRHARKITCPSCGKKNNAVIEQENMTTVRSIIADADPVFLRERAENSMAKLPAAQKELEVVSRRTEEVLSRRPYEQRRPSIFWLSIVIGWFNKEYKAKCESKLAERMRIYEDEHAAYKVRQAEWQTEYDAVRAEQVRHEKPLLALQDDIEYACQSGGILQYMFPDFVGECAKAIGRPISQPEVEVEPEQPATGRTSTVRKRGAAGLSVGPGGIRPWVRVGGMGMSVGKSGVGIFARKGPLAIYSKNGKVRVGSRFFRF